MLRFSRISQQDVSRYSLPTSKITLGGNMPRPQKQICKNCEALKKKVAFWRDLAGRYKDSIDKIYGPSERDTLSKRRRAEGMRNLRIMHRLPTITATSRISI